MLKRYGEKALEESSARAEELEAGGDDNGAPVWRLITNAVGQLANKVPSGPTQRSERTRNDLPPPAPDSESHA